MVWLLSICIVLMVVVIALSIKLLVMRKAAKEVCTELMEKLN